MNVQVNVQVWHFTAFVMHFVVFYSLYVRNIVKFERFLKKFIKIEHNNIYFSYNSAKKIIKTYNIFSTYIICTLLTYIGI